MVVTGWDVSAAQELNPESPSHHFCQPYGHQAWPCACEVAACQAGKRAVGMVIVAGTGLTGSVPAAL